MKSTPTVMKLFEIVHLGRKVFTFIERFSKYGLEYRLNILFQNMEKIIKFNVT